MTGSSDIPITPAGKQQADQMVEKFSHPFDHIFSSPEQRSVETARKFGHPIILKGLDAWYRGSFEGQPAERVKSQMRYFILHPAKVPPGKSPISGKFGESYGAFIADLMHVMRAFLKYPPEKEDRILIVTSGGNLQAIDQLAPSGFPSDPSKRDYQKIAACPYWTATGQLFELTDQGLKKVSDNEDAGKYYAIEHAATAFNPPGAPKSPR